LLGRKEKVLKAPRQEPSSGLRGIRQETTSNNRALGKQPSVRKEAGG